MFDSTTVNPPDSIFGLNEEFKRDEHPEKINLTVGMYQDETGATPVLSCVRKAESRLLENGVAHTYLPIDGLPHYNGLVARLVIGADHPAIQSSRWSTAQTPGGTGALRVAGDLLNRVYDAQTIWISEPTWANHLSVFPAAGLRIQKYQYLDNAGTSFDLDRMLSDLESASAGDPILLHTVCHNPTGADPTIEQWGRIINVIERKKMLPVFDFAYQGFGESVDADRFPIQEFLSCGSEALICNSFSKNFNLYGERVGAITVIAKSSETAKAVLSQIKKIIRTSYSNPPMHGAATVATVLSDEELRSEWLTELAGMKDRIGQLREDFVSAMQRKLPDVCFNHILRQRGMFSYSGLSGEAADKLKNEHSIYLLRSGRINIAGVNNNNLERLTDAIAEVMKATSVAG